MQWIILPACALTGISKSRSAVMPELAISAEKVGFLIEKTREFDVKEAASDLDSGSTGADDGTIEEWDDLRREAADGRNRHTANYLLGEPLVSDYLAEGLAAFGLDWSDERT